MPDRPPTVVLLYFRLYGISYSPRNFSVLVLVEACVARFNVLQEAIRKSSGANIKEPDNLNCIEILVGNEYTQLNVRE